jgi:hypothetical protein
MSFVVKKGPLSIKAIFRCFNTYFRQILGVFALKISPNNL